MAAANIGQYAKLFARQADKYAQFRPTYPETLYDTILEFASLPRGILAVDIATGTGQAARALASRFERVIGIDSSEQQLSQAPQLPNVQYRQAPAEHTGLDESSVDLVTVAQAIHWFDIPLFYKEARRILKPHGALAAWGYGLFEFVSQPDANAAMWELYEGVLGPYWDNKRKLIEAKYIDCGVAPTPDDFAIVGRHEIAEPRDLTIDQVIGYVHSWSSYTTYRHQHPHAPDPAEALRARLQEIYSDQLKGEEDTVAVELPIFMVLAKEPKK